MGNTKTPSTVSTKNWKQHYKINNKNAYNNIYKIEKEKQRTTF